MKPPDRAGGAHSVGFDQATGRIYFTGTTGTVAGSRKKTRIITELLGKVAAEGSPRIFVKVGLLGFRFVFDLLRLSAVAQYPDRADKRHYRGGEQPEFQQHIMEFFGVRRSR